MVEIRAVVVVLAFSKDDVIKLLRGIRSSNICSFQGLRTLKPRLKFILKNLCTYLFFNSKLNSQKLGFNIIYLFFNSKLNGQKLGFNIHVA